MGAMQFRLKNAAYAPVKSGLSQTERGHAIFGKIVNTATAATAAAEALVAIYNPKKTSMYYGSYCQVPSHIH